MPRTQSQEQEKGKRAYNKHSLEGREDGGLVTRSKGTPVQPILASYASVVKNEKFYLHPKSVTKFHTQAQNENDAQTNFNFGEEQIKSESFSWSY